MSDNLKKLTGKNGYEAVVCHLINDCDVELFKELVDSDDFLFDFVKQNVAKRISGAINESNYKNLIEFLKFYSPSYEDVIVSALVEFSDEDLTDLLLQKFKSGTNDEKTYCARFFGMVQDSLSYPYLLENAFSQDEYLAQNCAISLALWNDEKSYNQALEKLRSDDEFEKLSGVKFLSAYGNKSALQEIFNAMKTSAMAENIAAEIPYIENIFELLDKDYENALLTLNYIINGLGEILPISIVFDVQLYDVFERLIDNIDSKSAIVLLNAKDKFETLTENDEYLFDEDKNTKNEVVDIKKLLCGMQGLDIYINDELDENSEFVYTALDYASDVSKISKLLSSNNQTIVLKTVEVLKKLGALDESSRNMALENVFDTNIKSIIEAI